MDSQIQSYETEVLVIGTGGAGLRAALELESLGRRVLVVGKRPKLDAHTVLAAGGINAALGSEDPEDSWAIHAADTLKEGRFLGDPVAVEILCREAPRAIEELVNWGVPFARNASGAIAQRYFGAHRHRRTCFVGDYTGQEIIFALARQIERRQVPVLERTYISDLLVRAGRVVGAVGWNLDDGRDVVIHAGAVIVAAGGHIHVFRRSSSRRRENTGDAMALAFKAGATLADMELVQFHPSGMVAPAHLEGTLVTEAVRGEGGRLFNALGERYMERYDPARMELSTRDRVALASFTEIKAGRGTPNGGVWLDISHIPANIIHERLPRMVEQFLAVGVDITREPMEIAPTAHYSMGGVRVDAATHATNVPGLFAAGEATAGVHGANRLGGNSLAEILVFGRIAAASAARFVVEHAPLRAEEHAIALLRAASERWSSADGATVRGLIDELQQAMWAGVGVVRNASELEATLRALASIRSRAAAAPSGPGDRAAAHDLQAMLLTAEATVRGALRRTESRGAHQRSDHPATEPAWQRTITITPLRNGEQISMQLATAPIPAPSLLVAEAMDEAEVDLAGKLVE